MALSRKEFLKLGGMAAIGAMLPGAKAGEAGLPAKDDEGAVLTLDPDFVKDHLQVATGQIRTIDDVIATFKKYPKEQFECLPCGDPVRLRVGWVFVRHEHMNIRNPAFFADQNAYNPMMSPVDLKNSAKAHSKEFGAAVAAAMETDTGWWNLTQFFRSAAEMGEHVVGLKDGRYNVGDGWTIGIE